MRIKKLISNHNQICLMIKYYNIFCSRYYFIAFLSLFPITLIQFVSLFATNSIVFTFLIFNLLLISWLFIFFISFMSARVSKAIHSSYKSMSKIQWHLNTNKLRLKIKLESTFERAIDRKRIIGFSALDIFTINYFRFAWILIMYARFNLVAYKFKNRLLS